MTPRRVMLVVVCVAAATGAGGWVVGAQITSPADAAAAHQPPPASLITVAVAKQALASTITAQGAVAYTGATPLTLTGTVGGGGATQLVTRAPAVGTTVRSGDRLLEVSGRPVFLLPGQVPMYRTLTDGLKGDDVKQVQQALTALGYGRLTSGVFDAATQGQVKRWYEHGGYEPQLDGDKVTVPSGEILFLPTLPVRVDTVTTRAGATASGSIGTATNSAVNIQSTLPSADAQFVRVGMSATLTLPDGTTMPATVDAIGKDAAPPPTTQSTDQQQPQQGQQLQQPQQQSTSDATAMRLVARDPAALAAYANKAAKIDIEVGKTNGEVLVVPVAAVATSQDGSTRVQVQRAGGQLKDVPVRLGLTANGLVEVSGDGLTSGDRVVVGSK
ncbi:peptidoglycan-binding protein [Kutzneria sp. NPDC052558]|uniref:peptidoglycan-binding domain-containing protein n=1 Tax=Kutzneria sp. NPDC052558 TaxID=3364121 RepID=UPI0037C5C1F7